MNTSVAVAKERERDMAGAPVGNGTHSEDVPQVLQAGQVSQVSPVLQLVPALPLAQDSRPVPPVQMGCVGSVARREGFRGPSRPPHLAGSGMRAWTRRAPKHGLGVPPLSLSTLHGHLALAH